MVDAVFPADAGCAVCGAVVDDHVIQLVGAGFAVLPHPANDPLDVCLLIVGRIISSTRTFSASLMGTSPLAKGRPAAARRLA